MKPIYKPSGKAKEYGDYAINIYTGCPHSCYYCYAPSVLHKGKSAFGTDVMPREGIVDAVAKQLLTGGIKDKLIHLCFTCDPYPVNHDTTATREIINIIKNTGNHVQILTKGSDITRDFDLLDSSDWFGATYTGYDSVFNRSSTEPLASPPYIRLNALKIAHNCGINTWVSMEPVISAMDVLNILELKPDYIDRYKIGKLNYYPSDINWKAFGTRAEQICKANHLDYYIKDDLRREMEAK